MRACASVPLKRRRPSRRGALAAGGSDRATTITRKRDGPTGADAREWGMTTVRYAPLTAGAQEEGGGVPAAVRAGTPVTGRWLRPIAVLATLIFLLALGASWVRVVRGAT